MVTNNFDMWGLKMVAKIGKIDKIEVFSKLLEIQV